MSKRPQATKVIATNAATGETFHYNSMAEASTMGGFDYQMVMNCVRGLAPQHAGFTFAPASPLRNVGILRPRVQELARHVNSGLSREQAAVKMGLTIGTARHYYRLACHLGVVGGNHA